MSQMTAGLNSADSSLYFGVKRHPTSPIPSVAAHSKREIISPTSLRKADNVRFGSGMSHGGVVDKTLLPLFEKISEVFLWGFLASDMVSMWVPRITTSLATGAIPYDPRQDPEAQNLPFPQQIGRYARKNVQGLNWINLWEETKRELASGPGTLMVGALLFLAARRGFRNRAIELPFPAMDSLCNGFKKHLQAQGLESTDYAEAMKTYVHSIFADPALLATPIRAIVSPAEMATVRHTLETVLRPGYPVQEADIHRIRENSVFRPLLKRIPTLDKQVRSLMGMPGPHTEETRASIYRTLMEDHPLNQMFLHPYGPESTFGHYLQNWSTMWTNHLLSEDKDAVRIKHMATLEEGLSDSIEIFNRKHRLCSYTTENPTLSESENKIARHIQDKNPLHEVKKAWVCYQPNKEGEWIPQKKDAAQLTLELNQWGNFARRVWKDGGRTTLSATDWANRIEQAGKKLIVHKYLLGLTATILGGLYLVILTRWSQSYSSYQATRCLKENDSPKAATKPLSPAPSSLIGPDVITASTPTADIKLPQVIKPSAAKPANANQTVAINDFKAGLPPPWTQDRPTTPLAVRDSQRKREDQPW